MFPITRPFIYSFCLNICGNYAFSPFLRTLKSGNCPQPSWDRNMGRWIMVIYQEMETMGRQLKFCFINGLQDFMQSAALLMSKCFERAVQILFYPQTLFSLKSKEKYCECQTIFKDCTWLFIFCPHVFTTKSSFCLPGCWTARHKSWTFKPVLGNSLCRYFTVYCLISFIRWTFLA